VWAAPVASRLPAAATAVVGGRVGGVLRRGPVGVAAAAGRRADHTAASLASVTTCIGQHGGAATRPLPPGTTTAPTSLWRFHHDQITNYDCRNRLSRYAEPRGPVREEGTEQMSDQSSETSGSAGPSAALVTGDGRFRRLWSKAVYRWIGGVCTGILVTAVGTIIATALVNRSGPTEGTPEYPSRWSLRNTAADLPGTETEGVALRESDGRVRVSGFLTDATPEDGAACLHLQAFYADGNQRDEMDSVTDGRTVQLGALGHYSFGANVESIWAREGVGEGSDCNHWAEFVRIW
jgi:hypothetical protein